MSTAFQTVFDNATTISINKKKKVSQTSSRTGVIKTTSLGGQVWEFEVKLPDGPRFSDYRQLIEAMEVLDRTQQGTIQITQPYITGYQGNLSNITSGTVTYTVGNGVSITSGLGGITSGYKFRAGDVVQLGSSGAVYSVAQDVPYDTNSIVFNRPIMESPGTYSLIVGPAVTWTVVCVQYPEYKIFGYDQISWSGPFIFSEVI